MAIVKNLHFLKISMLMQLATLTRTMAASSEAKIFPELMAELQAQEKPMISISVLWVRSDINREEEWQKDRGMYKALLLYDNVKIND